MSAKVAIIGGHGRVALRTIPELFKRGYTVTALIRNPDQKADIEKLGATPIAADVQEMSTEEMAEIFQDQDVVVWAAGAGGGDPERTWAVDRDAAIRSMDAAQEVGIRHYVMVSYFGAGPRHGVPSDHSFYPYAEAKSIADAHLQDSDLNWTILRPSELTDDEPTGTISTHDAHGKKVSRGNVAKSIAAVVAAFDSELKTGVARIININDGDSPIDTAVRS